MSDGHPAAVRSPYIQGGVAVLSVAAVVALLYFMSSILIPCAIALVLLALFDPLFDTLAAFKVPAGVGVFLAFVALALALFILGSVLYAGLWGFGEKWNFYSGRIVDLSAMALQAVGADERMFDLATLLRQAAGTVIGIGGSFMGFLGNAFVVLLLFAFTAFEKPKLLRAAREGAFPPSVAGIVLKFDEIFDRVSRFFAVKVLLSAAHGLVCWGLLRLIGADFAELWAALAFALYMIPVFGTPLVSALAAVVCVVQKWPDWGWSIAALAGMNLSGTIIGSIIDPALSGHELDVSPLLALLSLLFWGWIWGLPGAILAIPLTAMARMIIDHMSRVDPDARPERA